MNIRDPYWTNDFPVHTYPQPVWDLSSPIVNPREKELEAQIDALLADRGEERWEDGGDGASCWFIDDNQNPWCGRITVYSETSELRDEIVKILNKANIKAE